jgi:hypothetical protein
MCWPAGYETFGGHYLDAGRYYVVIPTQVGTHDLRDTRSKVVGADLRRHDDKNIAD